MIEKINEVLEKLKEIKYGWVDKNGIVHKKAGRNFFINNYRLQTIEETLAYKVGTCWEQVELARYYLEREDIPVQTYLIVYNQENKIARHSILIAENFGEFCLVENSWKVDNSIITSKKVEDILVKIIDLFPKMYKIYDFDMSKIEIYKYKKPESGLNYNEFTEYCRGQEKISLDRYFLEKLNEFYIYANKGLYIDEIIEKPSYKLAHSYFVKDYDCNYVIDLMDRENFSEIEKNVELDMKRIDATTCYIITPISNIYQKRDSIFNSNKYKQVSKEVWQVFENFNNIDNIDSKCNLNVKLEKTTNMKMLADITEKAFNTGNPVDPYAKLDSGYRKIYENYKGTSPRYNRDFYFIKADEKIVGVTMGVYDDRIYGIYGLAILKEYRGKGIGTECLKQQLKICNKKNKKMAFLQTEEGYYPAKLYRKIGFKDICTAYYYIKTEI